MTDETNEQTDEQEIIDAADSIVANQPDSDAAEIIKKLRKENAGRRVQNNELAQQLADMEAELEKLRNQFSETSTKYTELSTAAEQSATQLEALTSAIQEANSAVIEALPEDVRVIVPEGLDPIATRKWLDAAVPILTSKKPAPPLNGAAGGQDRGSKAPVLNSEEAQIAQLLGVSAEEYAKYKK